MALIDFLIGALACYIAFVALRHPHLRQLQAYDPLIIGLFWVVSLQAADGYASQIPSDRIRSGFVVIKAAPMATLLTVLVFFIHPYVLTRSVIGVALILGAVILMLFRTTAARLLLHESLATRVILISDAQPSEDLVRALKAARFEYRVVESLIGDSVDDLAGRVKKLLTKTGAEEIVVSSNELRLAPGLVEECLTHGVRLVSGGDLIERYTGRVPVEAIDVHWYLSLPDSDVWRRPYAATRRVVDLMLALVLGLPFLVVMPLLALLIHLDSTGPVFLSQRRIGEGGRGFDLVKLRTMTVDAEAGGATYAEAGDQRVTRVGKFLRATRLDEFPQLLNIVRGEMSFIGPRPERPEFETDLEAKIPHFRSRLLVRPGLTGWAQVKGGYASSLEEITRKLEYDLYYIRNRSLQLDLQILFSTFGTVLSRRGR
ncbi:MAG TPA: exopolysaccharide biosynthesis polyprenyl glycosylphosphotransferase [Candidatus Dormibacteraeota bacterium]|nr:exopolysaccharide biosynthesis polyprenyl glycosylphosphotransferase [Candidatus Dormibacteraeota bacterium]